MEFRDQGGRDRRIRVQVGRRLDMGQQLNPGAEEAGTERHDAASLNALWLLAEEVEIEAEIEDAKVLLAVVRTKQTQRVL